MPEYSKGTHSSLELTTPPFPIPDSAYFTFVHSSPHLLGLLPISYHSMLTAPGYGTVYLAMFSVPHLATFKNGVKDISLINVISYFKPSLFIVSYSLVPWFCLCIIFYFIHFFLFRVGINASNELFFALPCLMHQVYKKKKKKTRESIGTSNF